MRNPGTGTRSNRTSTVLGRRLGGELQRLRLTAGLTQQQAAEYLSATATKVVKMESGWVPVRDPDIRALCQRYGQTDGKVLASLLDIAKADRERRKVKGWWDGGLVSGAADYIAMEDGALRNRQWQVALIPGLFQTAEYTRAMCVADLPWEDIEQIEVVVEARARRQQRLHGDSPLVMHAVIWEAALRQLFGGPAVMQRQLGHLCELAQLPNITIQVLPFRTGGHSGVGGPFNILSFGEDGAVDVVHMDASRSEIWIEDAERSAVYSGMFESLVTSSLSPHDSLLFMQSIAKGMSE
ncbi:helix-turn-helix domain-containing protein [Streptomyces pratensis]|uniref:helix-turn-helix domain-containing protein n=1 Tax=Streptomyces pratensis TaxID=1169025 RepID=UPI0019316C88|nr:helix-turn-helix transcriptional regulator [Streptomyces pratensis]